MQVEVLQLRHGFAQRGDVLESVQQGGAILVSGGVYSSWAVVRVASSPCDSGAPRGTPPPPDSRVDGGATEARHGAVSR